MMPNGRVTRLAVLMLSAVGTTAACASQSRHGEQVRSLGSAVATVSEPRSSIRGLVPFGPSSVVLVDAIERGVFEVSFARDETRSVVRRGAGPGEMRQPGGAFLGRNGTVLVYDMAQQQFVTISREGAPLPGPAIPRAEGVQGVTISDVGHVQYTPDTLGNVYAYRQRSLRERMSGGDSVQLLQISANGNARRVTTLRLPATRGENGGGGVTMRRTVQFSGGDAWAVAPDGRVAVVRTDPYRVEWHGAGGQMVAGRVIPVEARPVTEAWRTVAREAAAGSQPRVAGSGSQRSSLSDELLFAESLPPFRSDVVPFIDAEGRLWVERFRRAPGEALQYDVFDRHGVLVMRVAAPDGVVLLGADARSVYGARVDSDGLWHPELYAMP